MSPRRLFRFLCHLNVNTIWKIIVRSGQQRLPSLAAEMAYYAILGLFPGILALVTAIGLFQSLQNALGRLAILLSEIAPDDALTLIQEFVNEVSSGRNRSLFSLSFVIAIWASSGVLSAAMRALDQIHQISTEDSRPFWRAKLVSLGLTVGTILLLMLASFLVLISDLVVRHLASQGGNVVEQWVLSTWRLLSWPTALGIVSSAFAFIYRFGPSRWSKGQPLMPGAVLAALSWAILSGSFRLYVSHFGNYNQVYGAIGAVIILLLWLYLTALVILLGDQLNVVVGEGMNQPPQSRHLE